MTSPAAALSPRPEWAERDLGELTTRSARPGPIGRLREVWQYRELLRNLIRKELKIKYKSSVLGFVWTLLNPALYLVVFSIVFKFILQSSVEYFAVFLLSGLLPWNLFAAAVGGGCGSIVGNVPLVQKVWLPRHILPIAAIGAALMHFFFQLTVLIAALIIFQLPLTWHLIPLVVMALVVTLIFSAALGIAFAAMNVYLRDMAHLLELLLLAWFWMSAIVYPYRQVADRLHGKAFILLMNPMIPVVITFQRVIYNPSPSSNILPPGASGWWYARNLGIVGLASVVLLLASLWLFGRLEDNLAEEI